MDDEDPIICEESIQPVSQPEKDLILDTDDITTNKYCQPIRDTQHKSLEAELLQYYMDYNHVPFTKLRILAKMGILLRKLVHAQTPACRSCLYAKASKRLWKTKTPNNHESRRKPTIPGYVSVDMLASPSPGIVAQMTGNLMKARYK